MTTIAELDALNLVSLDATVDTDLGNGKIVSQHAAGPTNYVRFIVRPFKSIREQFLAPSRMMAKAGAPGVEPNMGDIMDWEANAQAALEDRIEADVRLIALTLTRPKTVADLKPYEDRILAYPYDVYAKLKAGALAVTFGSDPSVFFGEVRAQMSGTDLFMNSLPSESEMLGTDSSTKTAA